MNQSLKEIDLITIALNSLELELLSPVRYTSDGYEVILNLEKKRYSKKELREMFKSRSLVIFDIDTLRDSLGHYAYSIIKKEKTKWMK